MRQHVPALVLAVLAALAAPARAGTPAPGFSDSLVVGSLSAPTAIAFLPDGKLLITEKGGNLKLFDGSSTTTLVTVPVCSGSEMGLLGVAIDPNFSTNGFIYLYRTKAGAGGCGTSTGRFNQVVRVTLSGGTVNLASLAELLSGIRTDNGNHDGGVLRIGPDQLLWVGAGDSGLGDNVGGPGSATNPYAQDLNSLNGKVLRLNLDGTPAADNPFVGMANTRAEIWAYGFRNPFRMSFDGATGKLWIGDVGDLTVEEVDIGVAGGNYSWPRCEGNLQGPPNAPQPCVVGSDIAPIFTYPHSGGSSLGTCLIGGAFAGSAFGPMAGDYVFGDCTSSAIYHATPNLARDGLATAPAQVATSANTPSDFVPGPDGAIYYTAESGAEVRRLAVVGTPPPTNTPTNTPTRTSTPTGTATAANTPTPTDTPIGGATNTPTFTAMPSGQCDVGPRTGCQQALRSSSVRLFDASNDANDSVRWSWIAGSTSVSLSQFGNPLAAVSPTGYQLCIFDTHAGVPRVALAAKIPGGGSCGTVARPKACWTMGNNRFKYTNTRGPGAGTPNGLKRLSLKATGTTTASITVSGRGVNLPMPVPFSLTALMEQDQEVIVQLQRNDDPGCWEATFRLPHRTNTLKQFRDSCGSVGRQGPCN